MTIDDYRFEIRATLRVCCGFSEKDVDDLTWADAESLYEFYRKERADIFKLFAFRNLESTRLAHHGKQNACERYLRELRESGVEQDNSIDDQFNAEFG